MFLISQRVTLINPLSNILMRAFIAEPVDNIIVLVVLRNHLLKISGNSEDDASEILEKKCFLIIVLSGA